MVVGRHAENPFRMTIMRRHPPFAHNHKIHPRILFGGPTSTTQRTIIQHGYLSPSTHTHIYSTNPPSRCPTAYTYITSVANKCKENTSPRPFHTYSTNTSTVVRPVHRHRRPSFLARCTIHTYIQTHIRIFKQNSRISHLLKIGSWPVNSLLVPLRP